jgi:hypothetical protein
LNFNEEFQEWLLEKYTALWKEAYFILNDHDKYKRKGKKDKLLMAHRAKFTQMEESKIMGIGDISPAKGTLQKLSRVGLPEFDEGLGEFVGSNAHIYNTNDRSLKPPIPKPARRDRDIKVSNLVQTIGPNGLDKYDLLDAPNVAFESPDYIIDSHTPYQPQESEVQIRSYFLKAKLGTSPDLLLQMEAPKKQNSEVVSRMSLCGKLDTDKIVSLECMGLILRTMLRHEQLQTRTKTSMQERGELRYDQGLMERRGRRFFW